MTDIPDRVTIRVDASLQIGTGHVMRCLTLAKSLRNGGADVHFICRLHRGSLIDLILENGFTVSVLPSPDEDLFCSLNDTLQYSSWLGCDWKIDSDQCRSEIDGVVDWLIVDHYSLDYKWETSLQDKCRSLMVIDDLADRKHNCDLLLDQNLGRVPDDYASLISESTNTLLGTKFCLLRPEFAYWRSASIKRRKKPKLENILIAMGGVDAENVTQKVMDTINEKTDLNLKSITVVLGPHAPWYGEVKSFSQSMRIPTKILLSVENIAELMTSSDLSIGAGGSTTWERCALGLPSILICLADNQKSLLKSIEEFGAGLTLSSFSTFESSLQEMLDVCKITKNLQEISQKCAKIVDGNGAYRVAKIMGYYVE